VDTRVRSHLDILVRVELEMMSVEDDVGVFEVNVPAEDVIGASEVNPVEVMLVVEDEVGVVKTELDVGDEKVEVEVEDALVEVMEVDVSVSEVESIGSVVEVETKEEEAVDVNELVVVVEEVVEVVESVKISEDGDTVVTDSVTAESVVTEEVEVVGTVEVGEGVMSEEEESVDVGEALSLTAEVVESATGVDVEDSSEALRLLSADVDVACRRTPSNGIAPAGVICAHRAAAASTSASRGNNRRRAVVDDDDILEGRMAPRAEDVPSMAADLDDDEEDIAQGRSKVNGWPVKVPQAEQSTRGAKQRGGVALSCGIVGLVGLSELSDWHPRMFERKRENVVCGVEQRNESVTTV
jgi:hypothetical protein